MKRFLLCITLLLTTTVYISAQTDIEVTDSFIINHDSTIIVKWLSNQAYLDLTANKRMSKVHTIGNNAFQNNSILETILLPLNLGTIDRNAFYNCTKLKVVQIADLLTHIKDNAFNGCKELEEIKLPKSLEKIGANAFSDCDNLKKIIVADDHPHFTSKHEGALFSKNEQEIYWYSLKNMDEKYVMPPHTTTIHKGAFYGNKQITAITIPDKIAKIDEMAFNGCSKLKEVNCLTKTPPTLGEEAFSGLPSNAVIRVPEGALTAYKAAPGWKDLTTITIEEIAPYTLSVDGKTLIKWDDQTIQTVNMNAYPKLSMVDKIGDEAFALCENLTQIILLKEIKSIGKNAFNGCKSLKNIVIPEEVNDIGMDAFLGCTDLNTINVDPKNSKYTSNEGVLFSKNEDVLIHYPVQKANTEYSIPKTVTTIGSSAFENCKKLTTITIPEQVASIYNAAFKECTNLHEIVSKSKTPPTLGVDVFLNISTNAVLKIPHGTKGLYAANAEWNKFVNKEELNLYEVSTDGKTLIEWFDDTTTKIDFQNNNELKNIETIGKGAFNGSNKLTEIILPQELKTIEKYAFEGCTSLKTIEIPNEVKKIEPYAFRGCSNLESINVKDDNIYYKSIKGVLFSNNGKKLVRFPIKYNETTYAVPNGVEELLHGSFEDCNLLTTITLPEEVKEVGSLAFKNCTGLRRIYSENKIPPSVGNKVFDGVTVTKDTLVVPVGSLESYKLADQWKHFTIFEKGYITSSHKINHTTTVELFPNPVSSTMQINSPIAIKVITIYSLSGQQVMKHNANGATNSQLDLSVLSNGNYIVTVEDSKSNTQSFKIIKK